MLEIKSFTVNAFQENSYVVSNNGFAWILDPGFSNISEFNKLTSYITDKELSVQNILLTHAHLDHIWGLQRTYDLYQKPILCHTRSKYLIEMAPLFANNYGLHFPKIDNIKLEFIEEKKSIFIDDSEWIIKKSPGHSEDSLVFINFKNGLIFVGDVLFQESIGRTDLPGGNYKQLEESIQSLYQLNGNFTLYCGHGPKTSLDHERKNNPFVRYFPSV